MIQKTLECFERLKKAPMFWKVPKYLKIFYNVPESSIGQ